MDKPDFINDDFSEFEDFLMGEEHGIIRRKKGEVLNGAGDVFDRYFYVLEGAVRSFYFHETGNVRTVLTYYGKGALFPLYCPGASVFEMATSFVADTDTVLLTLAPEVMDRCVNGSASFNRARKPRNPGRDHRSSGSHSPAARSPAGQPAPGSATRPGAHGQRTFRPVRVRLRLRGRL